MKRILFLLSALFLYGSASVNADNVVQQRHGQNAASVTHVANKNRMVLPRHADKKEKDVADLSANFASRPLSVVQPALFAPQVTNSIVCTSYTVEDNWGDFYIEMYDAKEEYKVCINIYADALEDNKEYTLDDMSSFSTFVRYLPTYDTYMPIAATYKQWTDGDGSFHVEANMTCSDDITWEITYDEGSGEETGQTYELVFEPSEVNLTDYTEADSSFQFSGINENAELYVTIRSGVIEGEYVWEDFMELYSGIYLYDEDGNKTLVTFADATATVTANPEYANSYTCDFRGVSTEGDVYTSVLQYIPSEIEYDETVDIVATNLNIMEFSGVIIVSASTDKYGINLSINTDNAAGPWDIEEVDGFWSSVLEYDEEGMPSMSYNVKDAYLEYEENETTQKVTGWLVCDNRVKFQLDLSYTKPTYTRDETIEISNALIDDKTADSGYFTFKGTTDDNTRYVNIKIYSNIIEGEYTTDDFDEYISYIDVRDTNGESLDEYSFIETESTASVTSENGIYTFSGTIIMQSSTDPTDIPRVNITLSGKIQTGMDYDHDSEDFVAKLTNVEEVTPDYSSEYGSYVSLIATDSTDAPTKEIYLLFMIEEEDPAIVIPEGEYIISDSYEAGTVVACPGVSNGSVTPSFAGLLSENGGIQVPLWFLREGTVKVKNNDGNLYVTVDAKNSYGKTIDVIINENDSSIEQTQSDSNTGKVRKYIENNQVVIERDGVKYNTLGIRIK